MTNPPQATPNSPPGANEPPASSLELLYQIGQEVTADLDLRTLLHRVLFLSMKNVGAVSGSIIVLDENGQPGEEAFLMHGMAQSNTALQLRVTYESGMAGWVARHRQSVIVPDTSRDERWLRRPDDADDRTGAKSAVSVPVLAGERLVGVITLVHPTPYFFNESHCHLAEAIAEWAGIAILRAQLVDHLQTATQRYRQLFEDNIDPILVTDWQGSIQESNRQAQLMIGLSPQDLHSLKISALHTPDLEKLGPGYQNVCSSETQVYESTLNAYTGRSIPVQVHVRCIHYNNEYHLQWILHDITERKDLDRLREDLIAMVYHDLRSPLANIGSSLEMISALLEPEIDQNVQSLIQIAARSTERIQRLTESLLDLNRLEAGQLTGKRLPVNLCDLLEDAIQTVALMAREKKIGISLETPAQLLPVWVDPDMIRRVLINLIENGVKYSHPEGKIRIQVSEQEGMLLTSLLDDGPGIPAADQERIFEKFTRLRGKEGPRGLGLGLAFCRLAVTSHGGRIWVESAAGQGANFKFTLPLSPPVPGPDAH
ncbi:MAG: ATP-binding protein [Chloroflexota bacterium]